MNKHNTKQAWINAAIALEDRPETLTTHAVAEADQALVAAGGDPTLLVKAGGEKAIVEWYNKIGARPVRVEAGEGEDHDTGYIVSVTGGMAEVSWDSGVSTRHPVSDLTIVED